MLEALFGPSPSAAAVFAFFAGSGLAFFFSLAALSHLVFFVLGRRRYFGTDAPELGDVGRSLLWATVSIVGNAALMTPIHLLVLDGHSLVYDDVAAHGWPWLLVSVLLLLAFTETAIYWIHRALHVRFLYRHLHLAHHRFRVTSPWTGVAFHPLDSFAQAAPYHLAVFLFPVHELVYFVAVGLVTVWAVSIHDRVSLVPWRFVNNTGHHTAHHWYNKYNYGQYFTFWDRLCGTWKSPDDLPERFASSWLTRRAHRAAPAPEASPDASAALVAPSVARGGGA